jgi:hypothetical protein
VANEAQRTRFWADTGSNEHVFDPDEVDDIFTEAGESYSDTAALTAYTRVIGIRRLLASSAKLTTYRQNQSSENLSDVFKHLKELLSFWQDEVAAADGLSSGSKARFGGVRRKPSRIVEYPDEW